MIMFSSWPRLSGEGSFKMSRCKLCGRQSSHNAGQDGLLCGRCESETGDGDVEVGIWEAMTNGAESKGQTPGGTKTEGPEGQAPRRDLDGGRIRPGRCYGANAKEIYPPEY